ncbi:threonine--tRNA ligase [Candidatus Kuenenbacteria bacterium RIFCSPHIGHO2_02_FULL_39_13]|uniref:Threonine--tRNA ligase n=1 Tax=Candidatus Kuenenbacteria bacterium RIFCSPHIGHO2_02_FULL_39_13 TaxID=1798561 RepID=A0A1F6FL82_9BACT|nr:MAG: threonine--tRNA ligase [Candidatus Kuenenbacteria bacterium RIFCSPHIGHO2_02_FULL_39_13]
MPNSDANELWELRHSAEHILTMAMLKLYPGLKMAMGPATDDGFYFDFDYPEKISETDFPKIEAEMQKIIDTDLPIIKKEISVAEARKLFKDNEYKQEWIDEIETRGEKAIVYCIGRDGRSRVSTEKNKDIFVDLCAGPHVESTGEIKAFKLMKIAGAYWHGDEKNKMLTRIYGTAFEKENELADYLKLLEEAEKRDHRKLGKDLDLFVFSDLVGKGLPMLTPYGTVIRKELEKFVLEEETKHGYQHVVTPHLAKVDLYKKSGHYPYYKDTMYPVMKVDEEELILRPMTCPHHFMLYKSKPHSYRELPVRIAEIASQFRYEKSGELSGLSRVRTFCLADAHIICDKDQAKKEIKNVLELIDYMNDKLGLQKGRDHYYRLSLGDRHDHDKYYQDNEVWDAAEKILREVLDEIKEPYSEGLGEAAFYGPKIDIQMKKINGSEETAFTVQYDFVMPQRFNLTYVDNNGQEAQPIVIHRSSIGCFERTMAFLIEHYAGAFPLWLAPVQIVLISVGSAHLAHCQKLAEEFKQHAIRVEVWDENETVGNKIRKAIAQKIPYMLVIGDKETSSPLLRVRKRGSDKVEEIKKEKFIEDTKKLIEDKSLII